MATLGWMFGCWLVSALNADTSALAGYSGAVMWLLVGAYTFFLPVLETPKSVEHLTWHERLGLDALTLLKNPIIASCSLRWRCLRSRWRGFIPTHRRNCANSACNTRPRG